MYPAEGTLQPGGNPAVIRCRAFQKGEQDETKHYIDRHAFFREEHHRRAAGKAAGLFFCGSPGKSGIFPHTF